MPRLPGVPPPFFPAEPERSVYNNALLERPGAVREQLTAR